MITKPPPPPERPTGVSTSPKADKGLTAPEATPAKNRRRLRPGLRAREILQRLAPYPSED